MDTMNQAIEVLSSLIPSCANADDGTQHLIPINPLTDEVQQALAVLVCEKLNSTFQLIVSQDGQLFFRQLTEENNKQNTAQRLSRVIRSFRYEIADSTGIRFQDSVIRKIINDWISQTTATEHPVCQKSAKADNGSLIIPFNTDGPNMLELSKNGNWAEVKRSVVGFHQCFSTPEDGILYERELNPITLLNDEYNRRKVEEFYQNHDGKNFKKLFLLSDTMADGYSWIDNVPMFHDDIIITALAYQFMPDAKSNPKIYPACEYADTPEAVFTKSRMAQVNRFALGSIFAVNAFNEVRSNPSEERLKSWLILPLKSEGQEDAMVKLATLKDDEHEIMAQLLRLAQCVHTIKQGMSTEEYDAMLTEDELRQSPLSDYYRFIRIALSVLSSSRSYTFDSGQLADGVIHHIQYLQAVFLDLYKPYDALLEAVERCFQSIRSLKEDVYHDQVIWEGTPEQILRLLNTACLPGKKPDYWPQTGQALWDMREELGKFIPKNSSISVKWNDKNTTISFSTWR